MKKIININLSGMVIPIEDSAYEQLQGYIESLRRYFANDEGRDEIINDIETRVAELMNDKIKKGAAAVTDADVNEIISSMGRVEDFEAADIADDNAGPSQQGSRGNYNYQESTKTKRRLYRDMNDKMLGGVCAGIASYLNIDPTIVRVIFAILFFSGWGFLLYILLWIFLPQNDMGTFGGRRFYRNPQDKVLGGVASGLAAYFNKETWVFRLIFAAPILLQILVSIGSLPFLHAGAFIPGLVFSSLTSTFVIAYIVLWIILPEANTEYQKMEMRGEKVDINAIRQNVQEKAKDFGEEVKESAQNFSSKVSSFAKERGKTFGAEVNEAGRRSGRGLGHVIAVLFKAFFFFVAGIIAFALFMALLGMIIGGVGVWPLKNYILNGASQNMFAWGALIFFLGVPLIAFITWLLRRIMKVRSQNSYLGWMFGGMWVLGLICLVMLIGSLVKDFRYGDKKEDVLTIAQPVTGKIIIKVNEPEIRYGGSWSWINFDNDGGGFDIDRDSLRMANVKLRVIKSTDNDYHVTVSKYSQGEDRNDAKERADHIKFNYSYQDSVLNLGSGLAISKDDKFRVQRVLVEIQVPEGKQIRFDETLDMYNPFNIRIAEKRDRGWRRNWNRDYDIDWNWDNYFNWDVNVDYTMNANGELINPNKPVVKEKSNSSNDDEENYENDSDKKDSNSSSGDYRYNDDNNKIKKDKDAEIEELKKKLKEAEESKKDEKKTAQVVTINESNKSTNAGIGEYPSFSSVNLLF